MYIVLKNLNMYLDYYGYMILCFMAPVQKPGYTFFRLQVLLSE